MDLFQLMSQFTNEESSGRNSNSNLKQKPWRKVTYWLDHWHMLLWLSCTTQDHLPRDRTAHSRLGRPIPVNTQSSTNTLTG